MFTLGNNDFIYGTLSSSSLLCRQRIPNTEGKHTLLSQSSGAAGGEARNCPMVVAVMRVYER